MTLVLHYAARSDRGLVRSNNQDSVYAGPRLLALADGMGGHAAGEVASKVVVAALAPLDDDDPGEDLLEQLRDAALSGNDAISELVASDPDLDGMGTTLTAVLFARNKLGMVHIGDSRAYLVRDGELAQITHDDTFVQSLIDEGRITEEEAANHPQRSLLLRALTGHEADPSLTVREARAGDRYLLCSDGLTTAVSEETIGDALRIPDPQDCADRLIELALKGGGPDNVTVIVADVVDVRFGDDAPIVGGAAGTGEEEPPPDSSAARASAATAPKQSPKQGAFDTPPPPTGKKKRKLGPLWMTLGAVVVLGAAAVLVGKWWLSQQYFIGVNQANDVVIFQGVRNDVFGIALRHEVEGSCPPGSVSKCEPIKLNDLQQARRQDVRTGITDLDGHVGAQEAMRRLREQGLLPVCRPPEPPQPPPGVPGGAVPPPGQNAPAPTGAPGAPPAPGQAPAEAQTPEATPLQSEEPQPGINCRTVS